MADQAFSANIDPIATKHWAQVSAHLTSTHWLHDEAAKRVLDRIALVQLPPIEHWALWQPARAAAPSLLLRELSGMWPQATGYAPDPISNATEKIAAQAGISAKTPKNTPNNTKKVPLWQGWQNWRHWLGSGHPSAPQNTTLIHPVSPAPASAQVVVAHMVLHDSPNPAALMQGWKQSLAAGGVVFFTALGPDTLKPLQHIYARMGWPAPLHKLVDMHDWGDALIHTGLATPVMEMERLTLRYSSAPALLAELRDWGRNVQPQRFAGLRGRHWRAQLEAEIEALKTPEGYIEMPFEIIYGHAFLPPQKETYETGESPISLEHLRRNLRA